MRHIGRLLGACVALAALLWSPRIGYAQCYCPADQTAAAAPSDLVLGAMIGQTSRPLRDALDRRFERLRQAAAGPKQFASLDIAAAASGGEEPPLSNLWATAGHGWLNNDSAAVNFRGYQNVATFGYDHTVLQDLTLGVALSGDKVRLEARSIGGEAVVENGTVMPYARWAFADSFSLEALAGVTRSRISQEANGVTADAHAWREMAASTLNYNRLIDTWVVGGRIGTFLVWERTDAFFDSLGFAHEARNNNLGQVQAGANVGRLFEWGGINLSAAYLYDFNRFVTFDQQGRPVPASDRDGVNVALSANTAIASTLNLEVSVSHEFFRSHTDNTLLSARLAYTF